MPLIVTVAPVAAVAGLKDVMVGDKGKLNVKPANDAVPPGVVTMMLPEVPVPTTAVMIFEVTTVNEAAAVPPNETAVAPVKLLPFIVTVAPCGAAVGLNDVIVGAGINVNSANEVTP